MDCGRNESLSGTGEHMTYDTKIAIIIRKDLLNWQQVNVTAFLAGGLAGFYPEVVGEAYKDASGQAYTPLLRQPVFVYGVEAAEMTRTHQRAASRDVRMAIYTEPLFKTNNDHDNREAVLSSTTDKLNLVGIGIYANSKNVDKIINGLKFLS